MNSKIYALCLLSFYLQTRVHAQDAHYWQSDYGPGALLTPGAAVASDNDKGLFYFNPALMALNPKSTVAVSANIYQFESLNIKNGVGTNKDLRGRNIKMNPQMVAGTVAFKKDKSIVLGYALMHNPIVSYQTTQRQDKQMQVLDDSYSPGNEFYIGQYAAHNKINETVAMGSAALKLNSKLSVGLTGEAHIRSQDFHESYSSRALLNAPDSLEQLFPITNVESDYQLVYWHMGIRFRAGMSYNTGIHHLGLVISSPLLSIKGNGILTSDLVVSDLRTPNNNLTVNLLANGRQTKLPVTYKMPLSIAAAYALDYGRGQLYVAAEYFLQVNSYNIITPRNESFIRPDTGTSNAFTSELLQFREKRKSIINFAVGGSYYINPAITAIAALRTDFNYAGNVTADDEFDGFRPNTSTWNNYHCQLGGNFKRKKTNLRAGLLLTYGSTGKYLQRVNFDNPNEENLLQGNRMMTKGAYCSAGLLLSYVHNL